MDINYLLNDYRIPSLQEAVNYSHYQSMMDEDMFEWFKKLDPTPDFKYTRWIIECFWKQFITPLRSLGIEKEYPLKNDYILTTLSTLRKKEENSPIPVDFGTFHFHTTVVASCHRFMNEDAYKVTDDLRKYTLLKNKKKLQPDEMNILNIKSFGNLISVLSKYEDFLQQIEDETLSPSEYDKIYESPAYTVVVPKTHRAACIYGAQTRWCTAARDDDSMFKYYTKDGPLIIIIDKKWDNGNGTKYQIHLESDQWMDSLDDSIDDRSLFLSELPYDVKQAIFDYTHKFVFNPNKKQYLIDNLKDPIFYRKVQGAIGNAGISIQTLDNLGVDQLDDLFDKELIQSACFDVAISDDLFNGDDSYSYAYSHPWEFTKESPAHIADAEPCNACNGAKYQLPDQVSKKQYDYIASNPNGIKAETLQKILKCYVPLPGDEVYRLVNKPTYTSSLATKINQHCRRCNGLGIEGDLHDADLYSDEQRERVAQEAQEASEEEAMKEMASEINHYDSRHYQRGTVNAVLESCLSLLSQVGATDMLSHYLYSVVSLIEYGIVEIE